MCLISETKVFDRLCDPGGANDLNCVITVTTSGGFKRTIILLCNK